LVCGLDFLTAEVYLAVADKRFKAPSNFLNPHPLCLTSGESSGCIHFNKIKLAPIILAAALILPG
jgi:hypothetical protein